MLLREGCSAVDLASESAATAPPVAVAPGSAVCTPVSKSQSVLPEPTTASPLQFRPAAGTVDTPSTALPVLTPSCIDSGEMLRLFDAANSLTQSAESGAFEALGTYSSSGSGRDDLFSQATTRSFVLPDDKCKVQRCSHSLAFVPADACAEVLPRGFCLSYRPTRAFLGSVDTVTAAQIICKHLSAEGGVVHVRSRSRSRDAAAGLKLTVQFGSDNSRGSTVQPPLRWQVRLYDASESYRMKPTLSCVSPALLLLDVGRTAGSAERSDVVFRRLLDSFCANGTTVIDAMVWERRVEARVVMVSAGRPALPVESRIHAHPEQHAVSSAGFSSGANALPSTRPRDVFASDTLLLL
jgi:hypothetical protein